MQELDDLLDRLEEVATARERSSVADVSTCLGRDAFAPVLLALGLLALSPIGDIPGLPTIMSVFIILVGTQLAVGREGFWLPRFLWSPERGRAPSAASVRSWRSPCRRWNSCPSPQPAPAITAFSLALVAGDGLLAVVAAVLTGTAIYFVAGAVANI